MSSTMSLKAILMKSNQIHLKKEKAYSSIELYAFCHDAAHAASLTALKI